MEISENKTDKGVIIGIAGRLDTTNYNILEKKLMEHIDQGENHMVVDCTRMDYVSSSGLRILLMALKRITMARGKFVLFGLQENIREIFEISGFNNIFEIYQTREEAVASL